MRRVPIARSWSLAGDTLVFLFIIGLIYGVVTFGRQWNAEYNPSYQIDLSLSRLPLYATFSALRGFLAYVVSLAFTLVIGYRAAKSPRAEKLIIPFLDVMQSIPVLMFLPGLVLGLVALFPGSNVGLELASILMIFTGQVWNMTFAFYSSVKAVPTDLREAAAVMRLTPRQTLRLLELPYGAMNLTWNSVMSMAGGWFFLTVCEAYTLGNKSYHLPGLGAYMAVAIERGETTAIAAGLVAMASIIIFFDVFLWRPALLWAHRFRLEQHSEGPAEEPMVQLLLRESYVVRLIQDFYFRFRRRPRRLMGRLIEPTRWLEQKWIRQSERLSRLAQYLAISLAVAVALFASFKMVQLIVQVPGADWLNLLRDTGFTFARVVGALIIATLWATPVGIWIARSKARLRVAQPLIQLLASFPAPMLYPFALAVFGFFHIYFEVSAMFLMLLGVQWYILFNVLAGALRVPVELKTNMELMGSSALDQWRFLYLPSVFPSLVTGWVTAAGGAWNASIVAELITYKDQTLVAHGLGADISLATAEGNFPRLAACLLIMVIVVVTLNRTFWSKIYAVAQSRYRFDF
jgi:NitT/TauT family transport system permease protein